MNLFESVNSDLLLAGLNPFPTANTTAEYPSLLPTENELTFSSHSHRNFGSTKFESERTSSVPISGPETLYIVSEKPCFRADSLYTELSREFRSQLIYITTLKEKKELDTPIGFVIDVNTSLITTYSKIMLECLNTYASGRSVSLFLIGEGEDLANVRRNLPLPENVRVVEFERPVNIHEVINKISEHLNTDTMEEKKPDILAVDDSITFLRLIQRVLEKDYNVTVASSAFNCIGILSRLPKLPDLIIIDYGLPVCNGKILSKMIKNDNRTKGIPVIFYTSNANTKDMISVMKYCDGYILKNKPIIELRAFVDNFLKTEEMKKIEERKAKILI